MSTNNIFGTLKPLCNKILSSGNVKDIQLLQEYLKRIKLQGRLATNLVQYVAFPLLVKLTKHQKDDRLSEGELEEILSCFALLFENSSNLDWLCFKEVFSQILALVASCPGLQKVGILRNHKMKCTIPEISWHNKCQVLSLDILPGNNNGMYKLATGGLDNHVVIWQLSVSENGGVPVEMLSDLTRHNRAVNAVRFSPDGQILASADDEAALILWKCNASSVTSDIFMDEGEKDNKEHWSVFKMLRGHIEDISDLCWSPCSQFLISGSVDNSAIIWDISKGKNIGLLKDHNGFVQGVAWDPQGQYAATISSDRTLRFFNLSTKKVVQKVLKANVLSNIQQNEDISTKLSHLFHDDTLKSFCRRLSFSPDGEFLLVPSGIIDDGDGKLGNAVYLFSRLCLSKPVIYYPTNSKYSVGVRFCPVLFKHRNVDYSKMAGQENRLFHLPYRMVFAVATQNSVLLYDTQQPTPFAMVSDIHYTRLTDLSWSSDGRILALSSTDGYCSLISFTENEIGLPYSSEKIITTPCTPKVINALVTPVALVEKENMQAKSDCTKIESAKKIEHTPNRKGKRVQLVTLSTNTIKVSEPTKLDVGLKSKPLSPKPSTSAITCEKKPTPTVLAVSTNKKVARRVSLITLSSPKGSKKRPTSDIP